jgi:hypothetical protein
MSVYRDLSTILFIVLSSPLKTGYRDTQKNVSLDNLMTTFHYLQKSVHPVVVGGGASQKEDYRHVRYR